MEFDDLDDEILNELIDNVCEEDKKEKSEPVSLSQTNLEEPGPDHLNILSQYFGHKSFRPLQWEIISSVMQKRDVCAIMSTGYGKSLCFQFPSTFLGGITLVISPLIALMEDQVLSLQVSNIPACLLGTAQKKQRQVIEDIFKNKYSLVYLTPEFCTGDCGSDLLDRMFKQLSVVLIAIDEAHCISSWGHDFRHHYRQLGVLRRIFPTVPIIAVTATATPRVREDIVNNLKLRNPLLVCSGFDRPNIYFEVQPKSSGGVFKDLSKAMNYEKGGWKFSGSTIVYCITRKETEEVAQILTSVGLKCLPYHAGLPLEEREKAHELFVKDKIDVMVATIAFGMGIDKPDIRNIIHYGSSKSIENYYQEVGRAGRDGQPAFCRTFYSEGDFHTLRLINSQTANHQQRTADSLKKMERYLTALKCRRRFILEHFEDKVDHLDKPRASCCDICTQKLQDSRSDQEKYQELDENGCYDFTDNARIFLGVVSLFNTDKFGINNYIKFVRGLNSVKCSDKTKEHVLFGSGKQKPEAWWLAVAKLLIAEKYLSERMIKTGKGFSYNAISLTEKGRQCVRCNEKLVMAPPSTILRLLKTKPVTGPTWINTQPTQPGLSFNVAPRTSKKAVPTETPKELEERMTLYQKLLNQRSDIALYLDCMPYAVASNAALMEMSKLRPRTLDEMRLLNLDGFAEAKINKFGNKFLKIINGNLDERPTNSKLSIKEILDLNPLPDNHVNLTAQVTWTMFQSGLKIAEIAEKRGITGGTVVTHLVSAMKSGHPVKMKELGIDMEVYRVIVQVYRSFSKTGFTDVKLSKMKEKCPPEMSYEEIKVVLAYLEVRYHLQKLNIPYEEFEEFDFNQLITEEKEGVIDLDVETEENSNTVNEQGQEAETIAEDIPYEEFEDFDFNQVKTEKTETIVKEEPISQAETSESQVGANPEVFNSPAKKFKPDPDPFIDKLMLDLLDSPPRQQDISSSTNNTENPPVQTTDSSAPASKVSEKQKKSKKKVLPPWLLVKKIN